MPDKIIKTGLMQRTHDLKREQVDVEARTVELSFSSEAALVPRWFGNERLGHSPNQVRLGRLEQSGPYLVDHNTSDHVGVVERVWIDENKVGRAKIRFGKSARASEIFNDIVDGIRPHVSVGYRVHSMVLERQGDDIDDYLVDDWEPYEISTVSVPADAGVGVGREAPAEFDTLIRGLEPPEPEPNQTEIEPPKGGFSLSDKEERHMDPKTKETPAPQVDVQAIESEVRTKEITRINNINAMGRQFKLDDLARQFVENGKSEDQFRAAVLEHFGKTNPVAAESPEIGLNDKEVRQFSFIRAINAMANPTDKRAQEAAAFEFEASRAASERMKKDPQGILVPFDVLKRDLVVGTPTAGGHLVQTDLMSMSFIDLLRNKAFMMQLGTALTGLNGNVAIPRQTGGVAAYWVTEGNAPTEGAATFDQVTMSPETLGGFTDISRKLMLQSSIDVEAFVRNDLATSLALELDRVAINGSGSGAEPTGILNTAGIGSVVGGTNGLAPTWDHIVDLESEVAIDNADVGRLAYMTNAKVRGKLKKTFVDSGSNAERVWDIRSGDTPLNGYEAYVTNQVPSDLDKGTSTDVCSAIIFGNFADLFIGMWGGIDLLVDPYTASTTGTVRVTALQDADIAVRHAESFAAMVDALTA